MMAWTCHLDVGVGEAMVVGSSLASQPGLLSELQPNERPCFLKNKGGQHLRKTPEVVFWFHLHMYVPVHTYIHIYVSTQT